jgi:hypothetical protein
MIRSGRQFQFDALRSALNQELAQMLWAPQLIELRRGNNNTRILAAYRLWLARARQAKNLRELRFSFRHRPVRRQRWGLQSNKRMLLIPSEIIERILFRLFWIAKTKHRGNIPGNSHAISVEFKPRPWKSALFLRIVIDKPTNNRSPIDRIHAAWKESLAPFSLGHSGPASIGVVHTSPIRRRNQAIFGGTRA